METYKWDAEHCVPTVFWTLRLDSSVSRSHSFTDAPGYRVTGFQRRDAAGTRRRGRPRYGRRAWRESRCDCARKRTVDLSFLGVTMPRETQTNSLDLQH